MMPITIKAVNNKNQLQTSIGGVFLKSNGGKLQGLFSCIYGVGWERVLFIGGLLNENKTSRFSKYQINIISLKQYDRFIDIIDNQFEGCFYEIKHKRELVVDFFERTKNVKENV